MIVVLFSSVSRVREPCLIDSNEENCLIPQKTFSDSL